MSPGKFSKLLSGVLGGAKKTKAKPEPKVDIEMLIGPSGKLDYRAVKKLAESHVKTVFSQLVRVPVLAGSSLFMGGVATIAGPEMTKLFNVADVDADITEDDTVERSIYPMISRFGSDSPSDIFNIGRIDGNDIIIPDYTISKRHAQIRAGKMGYYIKDVDSTNGVSIDGTAIRPGTEEKLMEGNNVKIGRYQFSFLYPALLYAKLLGVDVQQLTAAAHAEDT